MSKSKRKVLLNDVFFLGPAVVFFFCIFLVPFIISIRYCFVSWNGVQNDMVFIGLQNFIRAFQDEVFIEAFKFTTLFMVVSVTIANVLGFTLALLVSSNIFGRNIVRASLFLPNVISGLILGFIWQFIFIRIFPIIGETTGIGLFQLPWLGSQMTGFWGMVIVFVWQSAGYLMVIYVAGLAGVPKVLIEAAKIDGAGPLNVLRHVTLPMVRQSITVCVFITISAAFKVFDINYSLTSGSFDTRAVTLDIYMETFQTSNYGYGTAKGYIFFFVVAIVSIIQVIITKRKEVEL